MRRNFASICSMSDRIFSPCQSGCLALSMSVSSALDVRLRGSAGVSPASVKRRVATRKNPLKLEFTPKDSSPARKFIQSVTITFQDDLHYIDQIDIRERSGDSTLLKFIDPLLDPEISPEVWEVKA